MEKTIEVADPSGVAQVRRVVAEQGRAAGLGEAALGRAAIVASEAASNILKYAGRGHVAVSLYDEETSRGVQILAVDSGPGMADVGKSSRDGHSTGGSLGIGLGAARRASDQFDIYSGAGSGTVVFSRIAVRRTAPVPGVARMCFGSRATPKAGEDYCGDAWGVVQVGRWLRVCVADGLGHGPLAAAASVLALRTVAAAPERALPHEILASVHGALRATRGAVMSLVVIDALAGECHFAGVGNVSGIVQRPGETHHLVPMEGIVGYNMRPPRLHTLPWHADGTLVLSSDGLSTRWTPSRYTDLFSRHPALIAAVLHRDLARDTDDATVLVARALP
jgi:anti-sigma regulatory factor (Ser/Thr protein kinase)